MIENTMENTKTVQISKKNKDKLKIKLASIPIIIFILAGIFGPLLLDFDPTETFIDERLLPPGSTLKDGTVAWLGTDQLGRNVLFQIIYGTRISLLVSLATVVLGGGVGVLLGLISGYLDRKSTRLNSSHVSISYAVFCL